MKPSRNSSIDIARGFTVFIMPAVHSVSMYGTTKVHRSWLGRLLAFLAEGPGAQLFMFLMGVSLTLGREKKTKDVFKRATLLMAQGLLLNGLRLVLPYYLGLIPQQLLSDNKITATRRKAALQILLTGDILQSAAISYLITGLLYKAPHYERKAILLALLIATISPKGWDKHSHYPGLNYFLKLSTGKPPQVFFPVFPWMVYTLAGLAWGHYLKTFSEKQLYKNTAIAGLLLFASGKLISQYEPARLKETFYRLGPGGTFEHLGIVLLWMCLCKVTVKQVRWNRFFKLLIWLSSRITRVYFIQWIVVLWLLPLFGYRKSGLFRVVVGMMVNTILTFKTAKLKNPFLWNEYMISQGSA